MSHFRIDKSDFLKIFTSWDFISCTCCKVRETTTCKDLDSDLIAFHQKVSPSENPRNFSFLLIVREIKKKNIVFQRKMNSFEKPLVLFNDTMRDLGEEKKNKEILLISVHVKQFYSNLETENGQIFANFQSILSEKGGKRITIHEK